MGADTFEPEQINLVFRWHWPLPDNWLTFVSTACVKNLFGRVQVGKMADKDTLVADIERLKGELAPVFERDQARITGEDRPFDAQGWALGKPDSHKYPTGAAFWVRIAETAAFGHLRRCGLPPCTSL